MPQHCFYHKLCKTFKNLLKIKLFVRPKSKFGASNIKARPIKPTVISPSLVGLKWWTQVLVPSQQTMCKYCRSFKNIAKFTVYFPFFGSFLLLHQYNLLKMQKMYKKMARKRANSEVKLIMANILPTSVNPEGCSPWGEPKCVAVEIET